MELLQKPAFFSFREALLNLVSEERQYFVGLIKSVGVNAADAEDVFQDAAIKAILKIDQFQGKEGSSVRTWFYRIVSNTAIDFLRKQQRSPEFLEFNSSNPIFNMSEVREEVDDIFGKSWVKEAILRLTTSEQILIRSYYFKDLTYAEIASIKKISKKSVGPNICAAVRKLKKMFISEDRVI